VLNVDGDELDLVVIYLLATILPVGPYPVLYVSGDQGSAKSTASLLVRSLVDPNMVALRGDPRDPRDLLVAAEHSWIVTMDNLSSMPKAVADSICRLTSGTGHSVRQNYADTEEVLFSATRPVLINGIPELAIRQDLADRTLRVDCQPIPDRQRRSQDDVLREFQDVRAGVLGALLDASVSALRGKEATTRRNLALPRLANVAIQAEAAAPVLGWEDGKAIALMRNNRSNMRQSALHHDPVAAALIAFASARCDFMPWSGTATELLLKLEDFKGGSDLPPSANALSGRINELTPALREKGVLITKSRTGHASTRILSICYQKPEADDADGLAD
jgi:hypothetical protein